MDIGECGGWVIEEVDVPDGEVGKSVGGCGKSWRVEQDDLPGCTVLGSPGWGNCVVWGSNLVESLDQEKLSETGGG